MALPKIQTPVFEIVVPSVNKPIEFRSFLVKEEKILLMAQQSSDEREIVKAIKQIVNNCLVTESVDVNRFTITDLEYVFLKLRAKSVNNIAEINIKDDEDETSYKFEVDLDSVEVTQPKQVSNNIKINDDVGVIMRYPSADIIDHMKQFDNEIDILDFFIKKCMVEIYDESDVYPVNEYTDEELQIFIDTMDTKSYDSIRDYLDSTPKLNYVIKYKNSLGNDKEVVLDTLQDFFILR
jgi:phosphotransferase system HPr-like phosphotransfer protein